LGCSPFDNVPPTQKLDTLEPIQEVAVSGNLAAAKFGQTIVVFEKLDSSWTKTDELITGFDLVSIAVSDDIIVAGTWEEESTSGILKAGSVLIYERSGGVWDHTATLTPSDLENFMEFAASVAVSGNFIVAGAPYEDADAEEPDGRSAAYVFEKIGGTWVETTKFTSNESYGGGFFGFSVAIYGSTIVVGHPERGYKVYVYENLGGTWAETAVLEGEGNDSFGYSVSIYENAIAVGAIYTGKVFVFERADANSSWDQTAVLQPCELTDPFGYSVAIDNGGVAVGSFDVGRPVQHFKKIGNSWSETGLFAADVANIRFGESVAVSDGAAFITASSLRDAETDAAIYVFPTTSNETD